MSVATLQLSGVKVGQVREQSWDKVDPRERFLEKFTDRNHDWQKKETRQSLFYQTDNFPKAECEAYHRNYSEYLERCWGDHLGVVFTPDILWNSLLAELASVVKADAEAYRPLFTDSPDKKNVIVLSGDPVVMPISGLIDALKDLVPTDTTKFLPEFSTSTLRSRHAFNCNFADMVSPYYNYMMYCCGFPSIDVRGDKSDYEQLLGCWRGLIDLFKPQIKYMRQVESLLVEIVANLTNGDFWKEMFVLKRCGSGSQVEMSGWWTRVYREVPDGPKYPENWASHTAKVSYKNLTTQKNYEMYSGLFFSKMKGDFLEPNFGFAVYEKRDVETIPDAK